MKEGQPLSDRNSKEASILVPTLFGVLVTAAVAFSLRGAFFLNWHMSSLEREFSALVVLGFAFSLIGAASVVLRRKDNIIVILIGTILWGTFVEKIGAVGVIRFILFSFVICSSLVIGEKLVGGNTALFMVLLATFLTGFVCSVVGLIFYWAMRKTGLSPGVEPGLGLVWGLLVGGSVGLAVSVGREAMTWLGKRQK